MAEVTIEIWRNDVLRAVRMSSAYLGAKRTDAKDTKAYERVSLVESNDELLERFWTESSEGALAAMKEWFEGGSADEPFVADLNVSEAWPMNLKGVVQELLRGYLTNSILSKWLLVTMPSDAEAYAKQAAGQLSDAVALMYHRVKPLRH